MKNQVVNGASKIITLGLVLISTSAQAFTYDEYIKSVNSQLGLIAEAAAIQQNFLEIKVLYNGPYTCISGDSANFTADGAILSNLVSTPQIDADCLFRFTLLGSGSSVAGVLRSMTITFIPLSGPGQDFVKASSTSIIGWRCELRASSATAFNDVTGTEINLFPYSGHKALVSCVVPGTATSFTAI